MKAERTILAELIKQKYGKEEFTAERKFNGELVR